MTTCLPAAVETCLDCKAGLALANASVLKGFCQSCFDKHMEERQKLAEEAQNLRALAQQAEEFVVEPGTADATPSEWQRRPRESEQIWFARVEKSRDKDKAVKQTDYLQRWEMSAADREAWKQKVCAASKTVVAAAPVTDDTSSPAAIVAKYKDVSGTHALRSAHPEKRWQMYVELSRLVQTGRAAQLQLTAQEKEELLAYIRFFFKHALPLSAVDVEKLGVVQQDLPCKF